MILQQKKYVDDNFLFVEKGNRHWGNQMDELKGNLMTEYFQIYTKQTPNDGYSLTHKVYVDDKDNKKLNLTGGIMTGDITIGSNKIISSTNPTLETHLSRKKYVDDRDNLKLSLTGGTMTGDITMGNNKIITTLDPTLETHLLRKKYVDDRDNLKLSLSSGTMTGELNMGNHHILHAANYVPSSDHHIVNKKYVTNFSLPNTVANIYTLQMDDEGIFNVTDDTNSIVYTGSNKKVEKDWDFKQDDSNTTIIQKIYYQQ